MRSKHFPAGGVTMCVGVTIVTQEAVAMRDEYVAEDVRTGLTEKLPGVV